MKTILCPRLLLLSLVAAATSAPAARISEPGTTFYGRVVQRVGEQDFPITAGELRWTIAVPNQANREYTLTARLAPLGGNLYSYKLTVPHQALAFDLTVSSNQLPLTSAGWRMKHVRVLVNGQEATLAAPATDDFTAAQASRAATHRIDLVLTQSALDSDGDGAPDWWEDENGLDKWNPNDGGSGGPGSTGGTNEFTGHTFGEWRRFHFPDSTENLNAFAQQDFDQDGIVNLIEYAFGLNPRAIQPEQAGRLPRPHLTESERMGIAFYRRLSATDLEYRVERSEDLMQWDGNGNAFEEVDLPDPNPGQACVCLRAPIGFTSSSKAFLRVRVLLIP